MGTACGHGGVLLAAGRSRRMGSTKQLLPVPTASGQSPMVCASFDLIAPRADAGMVVVTGHDAPLVRGALAPRRFVEVASDPDADMLTSVKVGVAAALAGLGCRSAVWLHLTDIPLVRPATLDPLRDTYDQHAGRVAIMPEHEGHGGHPALIPYSVARLILMWTGDGGLREFWRAHAELRVRVPVDDAGVVRDLDTPEAYRDALRGF